MAIGGSITLATQAVASLPAAVWLIIADWTGDSVDGAIARRNWPIYHTWLGDHDLEVDMLVALGLLGYLVALGYIAPGLAILYVLSWALILWRLHMPRPLGMLCQAPVYGSFILMSVKTIPAVGTLLLAWIIAAMIVTWPRFPREVIPDFLSGMRKLLK